MGCAALVRLADGYLVHRHIVHAEVVAGGGVLLDDLRVGRRDELRQIGVLTQSREVGGQVDDDAVHILGQVFRQVQHFAGH